MSKTPHTPAPWPDLVFAAPELLEVLEYALGWFKSENYESDLTERMSKAIAKAKGESC